MSIRQYSKTQLRWYTAGFTTVVQAIREKIKDNPPDDQLLKLLWRLGTNEYRCGLCGDSIKTLEKLLEMIDRGVDLYGAPVKRKVTIYEVYLRSTIHQTMGRAAVFLFLQKRQHNQLEKAYEHYQAAVGCMVVSLYAMIELPNLLNEFGTALELYGAFEAAITAYSKVLVQFPTFRGYFDALYRAAIVGRHLGSLSSDANYQQETIEKTIDILQFLLEALPSNIQDIHIVFFYARTFEVSTNMKIRFRSQSAYTSLYDLAKKKMMFNAHNNEEKEWLSDPLTWFQLGDYLEMCGESLIAKDAYNKFIEEAKRRATFEKDLSEILDVPACTKLALHFAAYQNFQEAIKYAEVGLKIDRYNRLLRSLICSWSPKHGDELNKDVIALRVILQAWKGRCWSWGFVKKLKESKINELEALLERQHFDLEIRKQLAYYAREKYRPQFYFEEVCATRIQRYYRMYKKMWIWQEAQRRHYGMQASDLHHRYLKDPYKKDLRQEVLQAVNHKFMPRKHPLHLVVRTIMQQNLLFTRIVRCIKAYQKRHAVQIKIQQRKSRKLLLQAQYVTKIQKYIRMMLSRKRVAKMKIDAFTKAVAAKKLQRRWLKYASSPDYVARRQFRMQLRNRGKAMFTFRKRLLPLIKRYRNRKRLAASANKQSSRVQRIPSKTEKHFSRHEMQDAVRRIQRFYRHHIANIWQKVARIAMVQLRAIKLSYRQRLKLHVEVPQELIQVTSYRYLNPGIDPSSEAYQRLLSQPIVVVNELNCMLSLVNDTSSFTLADLAIFGRLLQNPFCGIKSLILHNCRFPDNRKCNDEILRFFGALRKCVSITSLSIVNGDWASSHLQEVFKLVQIGNPRIRELSIEKLKYAHRMYDDIGAFGSRLLMDYFNYTIPGVQSLSLHGCSIRDEQIVLLAKGVEVNTSLQVFCCSLNWITDKGFVLVLKAIFHNPHSKLEMIDFSHNFINLGKQAKELMLKYRSKPHQKSLLQIILHGNRIHQPLHPVDFVLQQHVSPQLMVQYSEEVDDKFIPLSSAKEETVQKNFKQKSWNKKLRPHTLAPLKLKQPK